MLLHSHQLLSFKKVCRKYKRLLMYLIHLFKLNFTEFDSFTGYVCKGIPL